MKNSEIKNLKDNELVEQVATEKSNLQRLNFAHAITPLENPLQLKIVKKTIARLKTEIRYRALSNNA